MSASEGARSRSARASTDRTKLQSLPSTIPVGERIKVAIVDDKEEARLLLEDILARSQDYQCAGSYASGEEAIREIPNLRPAIALLDIRMPGISGIECLRRLKVLLPGLIVILVSGLVDAESVSRAMKVGGDGYLTKPFTGAQCLAVLRFTVARCNAPNTGCRPAPARRQILLNHRETEVMECIAEGLLNKQIAAKLGMSIFVVEKFAHRIYTKLHVTNRAEAVSWWRARV